MLAGFTRVEEGSWLARRGKSGLLGYSALYSDSLGLSSENLPVPARDPEISSPPTPSQSRYNARLAGGNPWGTVSLQRAGSARVHAASVWTSGLALTLGSVFPAGVAGLGPECG